MAAARTRTFYQSSFFKQPFREAPEQFDPADPLNDLDRDGGALEDAPEDSMALWAEAYDELNGAPENEEDR